jgi:hypothetical protein
MINKETRKCRGGAPSRVVVESLESRQLLAGTISGTVFNDKNVDGVRKSTESGVANQRVYIDLNYDGKRQANEPLATTDYKGNYVFKNVPDTVARLRLLPSTGWRPSTPTHGYIDVNVTNGSKSTGNNFGITNTGIIRGVIFRDDNLDGIRQINETLWANLYVFIDTNGNKHWDEGEPKTKTQGYGLFYKFDRLKPGKYVVRLKMPSIMKMTAGQSLYKKVTIAKGTDASNRDWGLALK